MARRIRSGGAGCWISDFDQWAAPPDARSAAPTARCVLRRKSLPRCARSWRRRPLSGWWRKSGASGRRTGGRCRFMTNQRPIRASSFMMPVPSGTPLSASRSPSPSPGAPQAFSHELYPSGRPVLYPRLRRLDRRPGVIRAKTFRLRLVRCASVAMMILNRTGHGGLCLCAAEHDDRQRHRHLRDAALSHRSFAWLWFRSACIGAR